MLLTNTQVSRLCKAFASGSLANIKLSKTQLHRIEQLGGFLDRLLGQLLKTGLLLIGNVLKPLAKNVLIPLGLTTAAAATDAAIHKKMFGSGNTTLIVSNEEIKNIMKIVKSLGEPELLIKSVNETYKNEAKEQKEGFIGMLLDTLGAGLLRHLSRHCWSKSGFLMPAHSLTNFEIQNYYQNQPKFNSVHSRNNLPKIKDGAYEINLDEYK